MSRVPSGDLGEFYLASYDRLVRVLTIAAGSREIGEELVQDAFVRLVPRWSTVSVYDDPEAWVRKVAFRLLSNRARRTRNGVRALARSTAPHEAAEPVAGLSVDVVRALGQLSVDHRQVVILHDLLDVSVADVARELNIPEGTVKSRLARARAALAPLLGEDADHA